MEQTISKDGTAIAFEKSGRGGALILVGGALSDRGAAASLTSRLAARFAVYAYDRRGRGKSGDTEPYAVEREIEDVAALLENAGGSAWVYGHSSGAVLALEAAAELPALVSKLAMYEPPFIVDDSRESLPADYDATVARLIGEGRRGEAVEYFLASAVGVPPGALEQMRRSSRWAVMEGVAHTLLYDGAVMEGLMEGNPLPSQRWKNATMPVLVMAGAASPPWFGNSARSLADILPDARYRTLPNQNHAVDPAVLAPVLTEFFVPDGAPPIDGVDRKLR